MAPPRKKDFRPRNFICTTATSAVCRRGFLSLGGLVQHRNAIHPVKANAPLPPLPPEVVQNPVEGDDGDEGNVPQHAYERRHPILDGTV